MPTETLRGVSTRRPGLVVACWAALAMAVGLAPRT